jgi:hypothetical protein
MAIRVPRGKPPLARIVVALLLAAALAAGFIGSIAMLAVEIRALIDAASAQALRATVRAARLHGADARGPSTPSDETTERTQPGCG